MLERISRREEVDLFMAWIAISLSFAIIFLRRTLGGQTRLVALIIPWNIPVYCRYRIYPS